MLCDLIFALIVVSFSVQCPGRRGRADGVALRSHRSEFVQKGDQHPTVCQSEGDAVDRRKRHHRGLLRPERKSQNPRHGWVDRFYQHVSVNLNIYW